MSATDRAPLVRAGPGVSAWSALPERDRALLLWLVQGDVVTAELAALLSYGHRRIAQRRLRRLVEYGLLSGFWAANRQRPRGRYAYALAKPARIQIERLVWPGGRSSFEAIETVSPVIHQLATHDLLAAFLRAADAASEVGVCAWVPERALIRLTQFGTLRPDALAIIRVADSVILLFIERDLGTERGSVVADKLDRYRSTYGKSNIGAPVHVGIVVESGRRAAAVRRMLRERGESSGMVRAWVTTEPELSADPHGATWLSPEIDPIRTLDLAPLSRDPGWPVLTPSCLATADALEALDDRVILAIPVLARHR
jgi:hypothetical protein